MIYIFLYRFSSKRLIPAARAVWFFLCEISYRYLPRLFSSAAMMNKYWSSYSFSDFRSGLLLIVGYKLTVAQLHCILPKKVKTTTVKGP